MKSLIKPALLLLLIASFNPLASKAQETRNVSIANFSEVSVSAGIELVITQGATESAKIVAKEGVIDEVVIEKKGSSVHVGWKEHMNFTNNPFKNKSAKVYISYKTLNSIGASSGSSLTTENVLKTSKLSVRVSSGATINAKVSCTDLEMRTSSGASASLSGTAANMDSQSSSGSTINAVNLVTDYAKVKTSSGADVKVNVTKGLETATSSGGNIRYKGAAALNDTNNRRNSGVSRID